MSLSFFSTRVVWISHFNSVEDHIGVKMDDNSFVNELVSDGDDNVQMIVDGLSYKRILLDHGQYLPDAINHPLHDKIILLFVADEVNLKFVDDLEKNREFSK